MAVLDQLNGFFRWLLGLFLPMFAHPTAPRGLAVVLHMLLALGTIVGAYFLQNKLVGFTELVGKGPAWLRPFWLALILLLLYGLLWSVAWLWALLKPNQQLTDYPDLDDAWDEIVHTLERAGIGLADTPLYLVLGEMPSGFEALFRAMPGGLSISGGTPAGSPLRVYANRDAIYLTLSGASLLGIQDAGDIIDLTSANQSSAMACVGIGQSVGIGLGDSIGASLGASMASGGPLREIQRIIQAARELGRPLTDEEKDRIRVLSAAPAPTTSTKSTPRGPVLSVLQNPDLVAEADARLVHTCGRMAKTRGLLTPINGVLLCVPNETLERDDTAQQWGLVAREDLLTLERTLKLRFPTFALLGGLENIPGGAEFFELFMLDHGNKRLGKGFPYNPDASPDAAREAIEASAQWVLGGLLPYWVLKQTTVGSEQSTDANAKLMRFYHACHSAAGCFARLLGRAFSREDAPAVYGGCYLAVCDRGGGEAKFAKEFFKKMESAQGFVAWTDHAYHDDSAYNRLALLGNIALAVMLLAVAAFAFVVLWKK
jgi:hypothetical protein